MNLKHRFDIFKKAVHETNLEVMSVTWMVSNYIITLALLAWPIMIIWKLSMIKNIYVWVIYALWVIYGVSIKIKYNRMRD